MENATQYINVTCPPRFANGKPTAETAAARASASRTDLTPNNLIIAPLVESNPLISTLRAPGGAIGRYLPMPEAVSFDFSRPPNNMSAILLSLAAIDHWAWRYRALSFIRLVLFANAYFQDSDVTQA